MTLSLLLTLRALLSRTDDAIASRQPASPDAQVPEEPLHGCGWFDSSHDLAHGLRVQELQTPEALAQALPLGSWLELQLAACSR